MKDYTDEKEETAIAIGIMLLPAIFVGLLGVALKDITGIPFQACVMVVCFIGFGLYSRFLKVREKR